MVCGGVGGVVGRGQIITVFGGLEVVAGWRWAGARRMEGKREGGGVGGGRGEVGRNWGGGGGE